jgi:hypothetical protein
MTCITFQYPVTRYDTTSSIAESGQVDKQKAKNNSEKSSTGNPGSGSAAAKTGTADLLVLHEKVAKLCETVGREWKCTILSTPMKGSYLLDSASHQHQESNGGAPNRPSHDNQHSNHPSSNEHDEWNRISRVIFSITITGPFQAVMSSKQSLIRKNPSQVNSL